MRPETGRIESNLLVKNQREQRRVQKGQGDCWQWQASGQCTKGDQCSFQHDRNKRAKPTTQPTPSPQSSTQIQGVKSPARSKSPGRKSPSGRISRQPCKDHLKGIYTNPSCEKWHSPECLLHKTDNKCAFAHRRVDEQPRKRSQQNGDKSAVALLKEAKNLGCIFEDMEPAKSSLIFTEEINHAETNPKCTVHKGHVP